MTPPGALVGLILTVLLAVCLFSPVAVGLSIADGRDSRVWVDPDENFDDADENSDDGEPYEGGPVDGEPDTHVYDFEKNVPGLSRRHNVSTFPRNGRVAILLRGTAFRNKNNQSRWCQEGDNKSRRLQKLATLSLVEYVILPLEQANNTVDVIVTDHECPLSKPGGLLVSWIGEQRVKVVETTEGRDQSTNILFTIDLLSKYSGGSEGDVVAKYSHVFVMRHDTVFGKPLTAWNADFSKVVFPFKCPGWNGAHDLFHIVPAEYFHRFIKTVDLGQCFQGADGHLCLQAMVWHAGEDSVDTALQWRPPPFNMTAFWYTYGRRRNFC